MLELYYYRPTCWPEIIEGIPNQALLGQVFYRVTARNAVHGIAVTILSVRLSVHPSVRYVYCDQSK